VDRVLGTHVLGDLGHQLFLGGPARPPTTGVVEVSSAELVGHGTFPGLSYPVSRSSFPDRDADARATEAQPCEDLAAVSGAPILEISGLEVTFRTESGLVHAVRGVDLSVGEGGVLGVVGESGCGKSVTMLAALGLLPRNATVKGSVKFRGRELLGLHPREMRKLRGSGMAMIFQDPVTSLNPVFTIGHQVAEAVRVHHPEIGRQQAAKRAVELLARVGIPEADRRANDYPHQFSGGMCQRAMIAMAIANDPQVLIADEPTTALDVTIQAQILDVLRDIRRDKGIAIVLITHDLGVVAGMAEEVAVLYAGRVMERGPVEEVYDHSRNPYTRGLLASLPRLEESGRVALTPIHGTPPSMRTVPQGCAFHPRCPRAEPDICAKVDPPLRVVGPVRSACHFAEDLEVPVPAAGS
jgi:oligopeptide/dipeptide ABC transporter ATP-binding protein